MVDKGQVTEDIEHTTTVSCSPSRLSCEGEGAAERTREPGTSTHHPPFLLLSAFLCMLASFFFYLEIPLLKGLGHEIEFKYIEKN
jgi:hypothetical protein